MRGGEKRAHVGMVGQTSGIKGSPALVLSWHLQLQVLLYHGGGRQGCAMMTLRTTEANKEQ